MSVLTATKDLKDWRDLAPMEGWCKIIDVYDGDTCWAAIDLNNPGVYPTINNSTCSAIPNIKKVNIRIARINAAEIKGGNEESKQKARDARDFARTLLLGKIVRFKFGKFGVIKGESLDRYHRQLGELYIHTEFTGAEENFSDLMLSTGNAVLF